MKSEKGNVVTIFVSVIALLIIIAVFATIFILIKQDVEYGIHEGQVIDKNYHSAYTTIYHNSNGISIPQYHPEQYKIKIQKEIEGKMKSIWISVDKDTYRKTKIGDYYGKASDTNENTKNN